MTGLRIALFWFGLDGRYAYQWRDGLYAAMKILEETNDVKYYDVNENTISEVYDFNPDVVLFWEAPITQQGKDADMWHSVVALPFPKALLFAGGPLKAIDVKDFDLVFTESAINDEDCEREGIPYKRAFGVNTQIFKPTENRTLPIKYDAFMQATFAEWKRHDLFAQSVGDTGCVAGRKQAHDLNGFNECVKQRVKILEEQPPEEIAKLIQQSHCVLNTASFWGGGQRCTLEAMACGVPVIVMADSPKNREYVEASGGGLVSEPDAGHVRLSVAALKNGGSFGQRGYDYVQEFWTEKHYAKALLEGILSII